MSIDPAICINPWERRSGFGGWDEFCLDQTILKYSPLMKIGVYVDGYNLYYGGRALCGRGTPGWRWLDLRALSASLVPPSWTGGQIDRVVYCTARTDASSNPSAHADQDIYLKALRRSNSVDWIEYGYYVSRVKRAPLAVEDNRGRPKLSSSRWPVMIRDQNENPVPNAEFMVSFAHREEKGSDVNVASHLLIDTLESTVDAAIVISNDSDLRHPLVEARKRIPVGTVNPSPNRLAGALRGNPTEGVGGHWWRQLTDADLRANQMADPVDNYPRPSDW